MVRPWYYCLLFMASFYLHWEDQMILCQHWVYLIKIILHLYYSNTSMATYLWTVKDQVLPLRIQEWQIDYLSMLCFNWIFLCVNMNRKACFPCEKWKKKEYFIPNVFLRYFCDTETCWQNDAALLIFFFMIDFMFCKAFSQPLTDLINW